MRVALLLPMEKLTSLELSCIDEINRSLHDITLVLRAPKDDNFNYKQQRRKNWIKRAHKGDYGFLIEWEKRIGEKLAPKTKCRELGALTKRKWTLKDLDADLQG